VNLSKQIGPFHVHVFVCHVDTNMINSLGSTLISGKYKMVINTGIF